MAPPPLSDLLDWRVPYVDVLAMICVSFVYDSDALFDGFRAPPLTGLFSPAASANGATQMASTMALAASQTPLPRKRDMGPPCSSGSPPQQDESARVAVRRIYGPLPCLRHRPRAASSPPCSP